MAPGKDAEPPFGQSVRRALLLSTCPLSFFDIVARHDHEHAVLPIVVAPWLRLLPYALGAAVLVATWLWVSHLVRARDAALVAQAVTAQALGVETAARQAVTAALVRSEQALEQRERTRQTQAHQLSQQRGQLDDTLKALPWAAARVPDGVLERLRAAAADGDGGAGADAAAEPAAAD